MNVMNFHQKYTSCDGLGYSERTSHKQIPRNIRSYEKACLHWALKDLIWETNMQ